MNLKLFTKATKRTFITLTNYPRKTPFSTLIPFYGTRFAVPTLQSLQSRHGKNV